MKNADDANKYYQIINSYIDEYLEKWKVDPNLLKNYLIGKNKKRLLEFLENKGLQNVQKIQTVLKDVIEDRINLHSDSIVKFENFKIFENTFNFNITECLYKGIENATIKHEKIVADHFDLSLSQIDLISTERHLFKLDIKNKMSVIVYDEDDISIIKSNIEFYLKNKIIKELLDIKISSNDKSLNFQLNVKEFIDDNKLDKEIKSVINDKGIKNIINFILNSKNNNNQYNIENTKDTIFISIVSL